MLIKLDSGDYVNSRKDCTGWNVWWLFRGLCIHDSSSHSCWMLGYKGTLEGRIWVNKKRAGRKRALECRQIVPIASDFL